MSLIHTFTQQAFKPPLNTGDAKMNKTVEIIVSLNLHFRKLKNINIYMSAGNRYYEVK